MASVPNFTDLATDVIDVLVARGWKVGGFADAGFWNITQLSKGAKAVDVYTPNEKDQNRVWIKPAKSGQKAIKTALTDLEPAGIDPAERRGSGVRMVRTTRRSRAKKNAPRARRNYAAVEHAQLAGIEESVAGLYSDILDKDPYDEYTLDRYHAADTRAAVHTESYREAFDSAKQAALIRKLKAQRSGPYGGRKNGRSAVRTRGAPPSTILNAKRNPGATLTEAAKKVPPALRSRKK